MTRLAQALAPGKVGHWAACRAVLVLLAVRSVLVMVVLIPLAAAGWS
ncbi:hypothetical protein ACIBG7_07085 [Nonomuraea sp. NPDC050328]